MERFIWCLYERRVCRNEEDRVLWTETKKGKFTVKSLYNILELGNSISFPLRTIWNPSVKPKVCFFA